VDGVQVLRAIAVLLVTWLHAGAEFTPKGGKELPNLHVFGIDVFFVISGFILALVVLRSRESHGPWAAWLFLKRRILRIYPIYWCFCVVGVALILHREHFIPLRELWPSLLLLPFPHYPQWIVLVGSTWTLVFEMAFYFLLAAVQIFTVRRAVPAIVVVLCGLVLLGRSMQIRRPILIVFFNPMLLEFVFGSLIAMAFQRWGQRRRLGIALVVTGSIAAVLMRLFEVPSPPEYWILDDHGVVLRAFTWGLAAAAIVGGVVLWLPKLNGTFGKAMVALGNASYSAYIGSGNVLYLCLLATRSLLLHSGRTLSLPLQIIFQVTTVVIVMLAGCVVYRWVESPLLRTLRRRFEP
jgi:peptidoglycan/LPS O-acetylase OafA/YrhL